MVVNGKGYGVTNLIALDRSGATLMEKQVQVKGPYANTVVVYRGVQRETYSCAPFCEPRVTLGDDREFFGTTLADRNLDRSGPGRGSARQRGRSRDAGARSRPRPPNV